MKEFFMKKSLIALAVAAASGATFAQTANVYGIADIWLGELKASEVAANPQGVTQLTSGGLSASRWGIQGTEDLGGGLKANFMLETGVSLDNGASAGFSRVSYVGLSGGFGEVQFGKAWTATDDVMGAANSGFDSGLSATNGVWIANVAYSGNPGNTIKYVSPDFGGLTVSASYSLDEAAATSADVYDIALAYTTGPIAVNLAYQVQGDYAGTDSLDITTLNGSYDFGAAKLLASYAKTKVAAQDVTDYQIGVDVPVSGALTVSLGYAKSDRNAAAEAGLVAANAGLDNGVYLGGSNTGYGVAVGYNMSKRTTLYGGFSKATGSSAGVDVSERQLLAVGLRHTF
ncbi:MAG: porin [Comamonadaceae bacterium CG17_big_fil_post_rev_8_21_14_2_50_60_13]|nr:MAG: porin [Comamonadaceae bacterium CG17_big_fil_post_rev_8_21_14_2_50_60_13]